MEEEEVKTSKDDGNSKGSISEDPTVVESQVTSDLVTAGSSNSAVSFAQDTKSFCEVSETNINTRFTLTIKATIQILSMILFSFLFTEHPGT